RPLRTQDRLVLAPAARTRVARDRQQHLRLGVAQVERKDEVTWKNAGDADAADELLATHLDDGAADDRGVAAELVLPGAVGQQHWCNPLARALGVAPPFEVCRREAADQRRAAG